MIHVPLDPARLGPGADRLVEALRRRGHAETRAPQEAGGPVAILVGGGLPAAALEAVASRWRAHPGARLVVLSRIGAHRDARAAALRSLWALEEGARGSGVPALTLRVGPMLGPLSPLWLRLRTRPRLPRGGRGLVNPVAEDDVVETLDRAIGEGVAATGWVEVAGPEAWSLAELAELAAGAGPPLPRRSGAWEPPLAEMEEHRLAEAGPWLERFGLSPRTLAEQARSWAATGAVRAA